MRLVLPPFARLRHHLKLLLPTYPSLLRGLVAGSLSAMIAVPSASAPYDASEAKSVDGFYAGRQKLIWIADGSLTPAASVLRSILDRAKVEGLPDAEALLVQVDRAVESARTNPSAALQAERALSNAWIRYIQAMNTSDPEFDNAGASEPPPASAILTFTAAAPSLVGHLLAASSVNPKYSELRDALWNDFQQSGNRPSQRALANLRRIRFQPPRNKYVIVDVAAAQLYMFEGGQLVDSMRVIVGTAATPTPLITSTIYSATMSPYWNVPKDLVQRLIAPRVVARGTRYLSDGRYEVVTAFGPDGVVVSADEIDWKAVAAGTRGILVRQLPGRDNAMGRIKVWFPNRSEIFLHDTPDKRPFKSATRTLSNGCIRLEDAERFGNWLLESAHLATFSTPDHQVQLPQPVAVYVTYLTMQADAGQLRFIRDIYGRDSAEAEQTAAH